VSLHPVDASFFFRWGVAVACALAACAAALVAVAIWGGCGARPTMVQGMPGVVVPIADAPPRRAYDAGALP
jgi:hypothetical protein